jgi:endoglucanase
MSLALRTLLTVALLAALVAGMVYLYLALGKERTPLTFAPTQILGATWHTYKDHYLEATSGRTFDPSRNNITTSEGESYTMLRAVWMSDKPAFDTSWTWTKQHLQHQNDQVFSWLYGKHADGTYGVLTEQNGQVTASDADTNIALALVFAYARWQDPAYLAEAHGVITDIWNQEVLTVQGTPYLVADSVEKKSAAPTAVMNPSYLSPAAYRIFSLVDPTHPWSKVVDSSYTVLTESIEAPLDAKKSAGIPPDWVLLSKKTGVLSVPDSRTQTTNFGFDALRVPWNLSLDYEWFADERDLTLLSKMSFFTYTWQSAHAIGQTYAHDGSLVDPAQSTALYGGTIGYFLYEDQRNGMEVYSQKLVSLYNPDINEWKQQLSYYDDNWAWFGIGLYNKLLPNLSAGLPPATWK